MADWGYTYLQNDQDRLWLDEGLRRGWTLPEPTAAWLRLWGLRHVRWFWLSWKAYSEFEDGQWAILWKKEWVSYAVWKGWV